MAEASIRNRLKRLETLNLVSFSHFGPKGELDLEGVGRTLDLSQGGILLEVAHPIPSANREVEVVLGIKDRIIRAKGEIVHQRKMENDLIGLGISFKEMAEGDKRYISEFLSEEER